MPSLTVDTGTWFSVISGDPVVHVIRATAGNNELAVTPGLRALPGSVTTSCWLSGIGIFLMAFSYLLQRNKVTFLCWYILCDFEQI